MKSRYKVEPQSKKSIFEFTHFRKKMDDDTYCYATLETGWRWGRFEVDLDADDIKNITDAGRIESDEYENWELDYCDDGCWSNWSFSSNTPESVKEDVIELWDEDGYSALEENDWEDYDCEYVIEYGVKLEKIDVCS